MVVPRNSCNQHLRRLSWTRLHHPRIPILQLYSGRPPPSRHGDSVRPAGRRILLGPLPARHQPVVMARSDSIFISASAGACTGRARFHQHVGLSHICIAHARRGRSQELLTRDSRRSSRTNPCDTPGIHTPAIGGGGHSYGIYPILAVLPLVQELGIGNRAGPGGNHAASTFGYCVGTLTCRRRTLHYHDFLADHAEERLGADLSAGPGDRGHACHRMGFFAPRSRRVDW